MQKHCLLLLMCNKLKPYEQLLWLFVRPSLRRSCDWFCMKLAEVKLGRCCVITNEIKVNKRKTSRDRLHVPMKISENETDPNLLLDPGTRFMFGVEGFSTFVDVCSHSHDGRLQDPNPECGVPDVWKSYFFFPTWKTIFTLLLWEILFSPLPLLSSAGQPSRQQDCPDSRLNVLQYKKIKHRNYKTNKFKHPF